MERKKNPHRTAGIVKVVTFAKADELLQAQAPTSQYFRYDPLYSWVYRGLLCSDYALVPSALRKGALDRIAISAPDQVRAEYKVLKQFFTLADLSGLPLPEDSQRMRTLLDSLTRSYDPATSLSPPVWPRPNCCPFVDWHNTRDSRQDCWTGNMIRWLRHISRPVPL